MFVFVSYQLFVYVFIVIILGIKCSAQSLQAIAPLFDLMIYFYAFDILGNQCTKMRICNVNHTMFVLKIIFAIL